MKKILTLLVMISACATLVKAQSYYGSSTTRRSSYNTYGVGTTPSVRYQGGYTRSNGSYVQGHYKTTPDRTNHNNFSTSGNYNPYTGSTGTRARDYSAGAYNYGGGSTIHTGPRGGQYYINGSGNKTYVPKRR